MKYHTLPIPSPRQLNTALAPDIRHAIHDLNRELNSTLQKLTKKSTTTALQSTFLSS